MLESAKRLPCDPHNHKHINLNKIYDVTVSNVLHYDANNLFGFTVVIINKDNLYINYLQMVA